MEHADEMPTASRMISDLAHKGPVPRLQNLDMQPSAAFLMKLAVRKMRVSCSRGPRKLQCLKIAKQPPCGAR